jgi:hypothetical protein
MSLQHLSRTSQVRSELDIIAIWWPVPDLGARVVTECRVLGSGKSEEAG